MKFGTCTQFVPSNLQVYLVIPFQGQKFKDVGLIKHMARIAP